MPKFDDEYLIARLAGILDSTNLRESGIQVTLEARLAELVKDAWLRGYDIGWNAGFDAGYDEGEVAGAGDGD